MTVAGAAGAAMEVKVTSHRGQVSPRPENRLRRQAARLCLGAATPESAQWSESAGEAPRNWLTQACDKAGLKAWPRAAVCCLPDNSAVPDHQVPEPVHAPWLLLRCTLHVTVTDPKRWRVVRFLGCNTLSQLLNCYINWQTHILTKLNLRQNVGPALSRRGHSCR
jgi:hypothetical protein